MCVGSRKGEMPVELPVYFCLHLAANVAGIALLPRAHRIHGHNVNPIAGVFAPKKVPISGELDVFRQLQTKGGVQINDVCRTDHLGFAVLAGVSYSVAREWFQLHSFPAVCGKIFWQDFVLWRRTRNSSKLSSENQSTASLSGSNAAKESHSWPSRAAFATFSRAEATTIDTVITEDRKN